MYGVNKIICAEFQVVCKVFARLGTRNPAKNKWSDCTIQGSDEADFKMEGFWKWLDFCTNIFTSGFACQLFMSQGKVEGRDLSDLRLPRMNPVTPILF